MEDIDEEVGFEDEEIFRRRMKLFLDYGDNLDENYIRRYLNDVA